MGNKYLQSAPFKNITRQEGTMDRRSFERFPFNNFVAYKPSRFSAGEESVTNNISLKGACILTEKGLKPQGKIKLRLFFGPKVGAKEVNARVVYSKPVEDSLGKGYLNGVEFSELIFNDKKELLENEY
jgi:hypothetical protein